MIEQFSEKFIGVAKAFTPAKVSDFLNSYPLTKETVYSDVNLNNELVTYMTNDATIPYVAANYKAEELEWLCNIIKSKLYVVL